MKTFATKEKRSAPTLGKARPYVHHPIGPMQQAQQAEIRAILRSTGAQAKLTIGQPNDKYEQEADRVADQVMRMSDADVAQRVDAGTIQPMQIQHMGPECEEEMAQRQPEEEEEEILQAKEMPEETPEVTLGLESRINSMKVGGQPLNPATRTFFEPRFGHDFGHVRVYTDSAAANTAKAINARAFTLGNHVVMGSGEYQPTSQSGQRILGHELTHVVQQSRATPSPQGTVQRAAPAAVAPLIGMALLRRCIVGGLIGMAFDAAIQYGLHLWRLRRWPWERAREAWESYRHNWCLTALSLVLGCFGAIAAHRWIQPFLRRHPRLSGAAGATLLGRLLIWLATQGILLPRIAVKWLAKLGCIRVFEAESLSPGITSEEAISEAPEAIPAQSLERR